VDTRNKIVAAPWPGFEKPLVVVTGYFDVLRAEHVRDLEESRAELGSGTLVAIVVANSGALLPQRARAELVAALRSVDYVALADANDVEALVASLGPERVVRLEEADERRARELRELVRSRSRNA
jgi:glycerol-3-phosphate cytidylyltransferase-like family protein